MTQRQSVTLTVVANLKLPKVNLELSIYYTIQGFRPLAFEIQNGRSFGKNFQRSEV